MNDEELSYILDLFRNRYTTLYYSGDIIDLLLYSINKYLKTPNNNQENITYNNIYSYDLTNKMALFINEYETQKKLNNNDNDNNNELNDIEENYARLYKILTQKIYFYEITYFDLIAIHIFDYVNISESNFQKLQKIINRCFFDKSYHVKSLIKRLELLIYDSYQNLMNVYYQNMLDLNLLFNPQHINMIFGYFYLLGLNDKLNRNEYWSLLDISFNYTYQLITFINTQITYNEILIKNFETDGLHSIVTKQKSFLLKLITKLFNKTGIFLINNPKNIEEYRIFYNLYDFFNNELNSPQFIKFKQLYSQNHYSEGLSQSYLNALNFTISKTPYKKYLINYKLIFENSNILLNENYYLNIDNNFAIFMNINKLFDKIININPNINIDDIQFIESWKNKYYNYIFHLLDKIPLASSRLISFSNSYNYTKELSYYDYQIFTVDVFFLSKIIKELPIITRNILNKNRDLNFNVLSIEKYILIIFQLYTNPNFTKLFTNLLKKKIFSTTLRCKNAKILFNDFHKIVKSKNESWLTIMSYLESDDNMKKEIINKLAQTEFDYKKLESVFLNYLNKSWFELFNKFNDTNYQEKLNTYIDDFGDPFTNEMIKTPMILPLTGQTVDKDVIIKILHNKPCNPFNNMPLSIKELEEYNQKPEIKNQNQIFMEKLEKINLELNSLLENEL
jgi:hypothetical protein